jgi:hypothetical protein
MWEVIHRRGRSLKTIRSQKLDALRIYLREVHMMSESAAADFEKRIMKTNHHQNGNSFLSLEGLGHV